MASRKSAKNKTFTSLVTVIILLIIVLLSEKTDLRFFSNETPENLNADFAVHFIDIGQGDCVLIQSNGKNMLIDAGENGNEQIVLDYLDKYNADSFEYIVATHPHSDHIGGLAEVIEASAVSNIIMPRLSKSNTPTTMTYEKLLTAAKSSGARIIAAVPGNVYSVGGAEFEIFAPFEQDDNLNNMSVVIKLTYQGRSFLFTGDAEKQVEKQLINSEYDLSADVFKLGHHGSSTSNTLGFLNAVNPGYAVISCGENNDYGHPHREVIEAIYDLEIPVYRTDEDGSIVFTVTNNTIEVYTEK